jgi:hypothetical protein
MRHDRRSVLLGDLFGRSLLNLRPAGEVLVRSNDMAD